MAVYTTEIASDQISSDNPIHQRLLKAYVAVLPYIKGSVLELGCGEGRGVELLMEHADDFTGLDKIQEVIDKLSGKYPNAIFRQAVFPPFDDIADNTYDTIVSFQVIEHIQNDKLYLQEIQRVLKPGGKAVLSTPNIKMTLSRNPWHEREYTADELKSLAQKYFSHVDMKGIAGNDKIMQYHDQNRASVRKITKWDIFNLQYRLPAPVLRLPYDILNRLNRNSLEKTADELVASITHEDYLLRDQHEENLDLFCILTK
ncbi:MAG: methyltransferase domain-containing protein [Cyclobacteriaceae bacterium]